MTSDLAKQRVYRAANGNAATKRYEKTKHGFLMRAYRNMQSRVKGVQRAKRHLYAGKPLLDKADFYQWAEDSSTFHRLFAAWEVSGYDRKLTPSPDRKDSSQGYVVGNLEWVTHSENSRRGGVSRWAKVRAQEAAL